MPCDPEIFMTVSGLFVYGHFILPHRAHFSSEDIPFCFSRFGDHDSSRVGQCGSM